MKITVKAEWMKACGYPAEDTVMQVTFVYPQRLPDGTRMFDVIRPDGRKWTVAEWRCKAIEEARISHYDVADKNDGGHVVDCGCNMCHSRRLAY